MVPTEELVQTIAELTKRTDELYNAILGPRLLKNTGVLHRLEVQESNNTTIMKKLLEIEKKFDEEMESIKIERARILTKMNVVWCVAGGFVMFLVEYFTKTK